MDIVENIKLIVDNHHKMTEGKCGIPIPEMQKQSGLTIDELKPILRELYDKKYIKVREGLNGKLIFKKV